MPKFLKRWLGITAIEDEIRVLREKVTVHQLQMKGDMIDLQSLVADKVNKFLEETRIDVDIGARGPNTVILTGVVRGRGYVEFYELNNHEFHDFVERMKYMRKTHLIRHIDQPMGFDFKGYFDIKGK